MQGDLWKQTFHAVKLECTYYKEVKKMHATLLGQSWLGGQLGGTSIPGVLAHLPLVDKGAGHESKSLHPTRGFSAQTVAQDLLSRISPPGATSPSLLAQDSGELLSCRVMIVDHPAMQALLVKPLALTVTRDLLTDSFWSGADLHGGRQPRGQ